MTTAPDSPIVVHTPLGDDIDSRFDVKVIYPGTLSEVDVQQVPALFLPRVGPFQLIDYEKIYALNPDQDIWELRGVDTLGAVVVVRPDQYVAAVLPLTARAELAAFFAQNMLVNR